MGWLSGNHRQINWSITFGLSSQTWKYKNHLFYIVAYVHTVLKNVILNEHALT